MPKFNLHIMDGKEAEVEIEAMHSHEAIETGVTALAQFVSNHFRRLRIYRWTSAMNRVDPSPQSVLPSI